MKKRLKKDRIYLVTIIMGIIVFSYPFIAKIINKQNQTYVICKYNEEIQDIEDEELEKQKKEYEKNNNSNIKILKNGKILGYLSIDKISVFLPIYEGTEDKILSKGVGHLKETSIPTQKGNYHAVFVGHSGLTSKKILDDLEKLEKGNIFEVTILNQKFKYIIYKIKKVLPTQTQDLKYNKNKKLVTLVTCTPKYVNSHRLLVMGELVK